MVREGYKQTEVGVIPEDWKVALISDLTTEVGDGIHTTPIYSNNGNYHFINGNNLFDGEIVFTEDTKRADESEFKKHKKNLGEGTILLSINGTIGNLAFYKGESIILGKSAAYLNVRKEVSKHYLYFALQTRSVADFFEDGLTGTTIRNLGLGTIRDTPIVIPQDYEEQRSIATALSDVDALIAALDKLIAKKRHLKTATMQQLLTGKKRLPGFGEGKGYKQTEVGVIPEDWGDLSLIEVVDIIDGDRGSNYPSDSDFYADGYCLFLSARNVTKEGFRFSECFFVTQEKDQLLRKGKLSRFDIVLTTRGTVGNFAFYDESIPYNNIRINSGMVILRNGNSGFENRFLYLILNSYVVQNQIERAVFGSAQPQLTVKGIGEFIIPLPHDVEEQRAIATVLSDMDAEIAALEARRAKTQAIKQGMMQELLTGRTRLV
jgi:type I restriction enzyme S subunit